MNSSVWWRTGSVDAANIVWTLAGFVLILVAWPLLWVGIAGNGFGFATRGVLAVLGGCYRALLAGEVTALLTLGALLLPGVLLLTRFVAHLVLLLLETRRLLGSLAPKRGTPPERVRLLARHAGLTDRLVYYRDPAVYAFVYGVRISRVALSAGMTWALSDRELLAVLRHEAHHLRQGGVLRHLLREGLKASLGFLPRVEVLVEADRLGDELAADRYASEADPEALVSALIKLARLGIAAVDLPATSGWFERRIRAVCGLDPPRPVSPPHMWLAFVLSLFLLTVPLLGHAVDWQGMEVHLGTAITHVGTTTC